MKTSVHLTRSNGYRELGMFDQSILELEEIEGDDRWKYEVIKAKYLTYRDAKAFEEAEQMMKDKAHLRELSEKYGFKEV